jgi:acetyl esterase/lipase
MRPLPKGRGRFGAAEPGEGVGPRRNPDGTNLQDFFDAPPPHPAFGHPFPKGRGSTGAHFLWVKVESSSHGPLIFFEVLPMPRIAFFIALFVAMPVFSADKPEVVNVWPAAAPDEPGTIGKEYTRPSPSLDKKQVEVTESTLLITNVTTPTLTIRRPAKDKDTGTAVIICPGGGYWNLYWQLEGEEVAAWLNSLGVTGIILKYRVPRRPGEPEKDPARRPLQDAQRAVRLVRSKAKEWGLHPDRLGIMGFSAGGHLAFATATGFEKRTYDPIDDVDKTNCRPDFAVPVYSGYLKAKDKPELAPGLAVPKNCPPVFLVHGGADLVSDPEHSVAAYLALKRAGASAELHVYADTAHDFGVRKSDRPYGGWTKACEAWMRGVGVLKQ